MPIPRPSFVPATRSSVASPTAEHASDAPSLAANEDCMASVYTLAPEALSAHVRPRTRQSAPAAPPEPACIPCFPRELAPLSGRGPRPGEVQTQHSLMSMAAMYGHSRDPASTYAALLAFAEDHAKARTSAFDKAICQDARRVLLGHGDGGRRPKSKQPPTYSVGHPSNRYALDLLGRAQPRSVKYWVAMLWQAIGALPATVQLDARRVFVGALAECKVDGHYLSAARQLQRMLAYLKDYFPAQICVVTPPLNARTYVTALDVLVRGHLAENSAAQLPADTVALLHREALELWEQANVHDGVCYDNGYLTFEETAARAFALQQGMADLMNGRYKLAWPVPTLPDDDDRLFDEARARLDGVNPRDMDPQACVAGQKRRMRNRNVRELLARAGGMAAGAPFGPYAMLLCGQAAVHAERAVSGEAQNFRVGAVRAVGMSLGTMAGGRPATVVLAGSFANEVDAAAGRAFAFIKALRVRSTWPMREETAPLFIDSDRDEEEDAYLLSDWEVIARVRSRSR